MNIIMDGNFIDIILAKITRGRRQVEAKENGHRKQREYKSREERRVQGVEIEG